MKLLPKRVIRGRYTQEIKPAMTNSDSIINASLEMFAAFTNGDRTAVHANLRKAVYATALKHQGKEAYVALLSFFRRTRDPDESQTALLGLGNTRDPKCMQQMLDLLLTDEIKAQNVSILSDSLVSELCLTQTSSISP